MGRDIYFDVFLVPGGELDMAVNLRELSRSESKLLKGKRAGGKKVYFSGTMAALNDEMITDDEHLMDVWGMVHWNMNDLYNMTAGQYKAYWLKNMKKPNLLSVPIRKEVRHTGIFYWLRMICFVL